jgi:hypothetical protein
MSDDLEAVLRRVAAGDLTPEQALQQLGAPASNPAPSAESGAEPSGITTVRLRTSYRSVQLLADPTVAQLHVLGEHSIRHEGPALVISTAGPLDDDRDGEPSHPAAEGSGHFSFSDLPRTIAWARSWREHQLTVRVNPALLLDLDVTGADVKAVGFEGGLRARLVASSLRGDKLHGRLDVEAVSSSVKLTGVPTGSSRIGCESSSVRLALATGSDLKIVATNRMGRLALPEQPPSTLPFEGETSEATIGGGRDRLVLEAVMSSVTVSAQTWGQAPA